MKNLILLSWVFLLDIYGLWSITLNWVKTYIFSDFEYLQWLAIAMILDLITGVSKSIVKGGLKSITSKLLRQFVIKSIQYGTFLVITHVLTHFKIEGDVVASDSLNWINFSAYKLLILIEIKSVYENLVEMDSRMDFVRVMIDGIKKHVSNLASKTEKEIEKSDKD
jgi:hypothetical protein